MADAPSDRFATEGVLFEQTFSAHIPTTSAYASMLTGMDVFTTQVVALRHKGPLRPEVQAPIIVTVHAPAHPGYDFKRFYEGAKRRGFILYPGKLTEVETFRVGCIGAIGPEEMHQAVHAIADALSDLGIRDIGKPAPARAA